MADIINLNKARKAKAKQGKSQKATENRILYGIATMGRKIEKERQKKEAQTHENHRLGTESHNKNLDAPQ